MTKSVRIGAKSSFLLVLSASVLYAIGVQGIRSGPGPSSFDGLASLFGMERRTESERIQSPAADMTVGEPAVLGLAPASVEAGVGVNWAAVDPAATMPAVAVEAVRPSAPMAGPAASPVTLAPAVAGPGLAPLRAPLAQEDLRGRAGLLEPGRGGGECSVDLPAVSPLVGGAGDDGAGGHHGGLDDADVPAGGC